MSPSLGGAARSALRIAIMPANIVRLESALGLDQTCVEPVEIATVVLRPIKSSSATESTVL